MLRSHYAAGTGAVLCETSEEQRFIASMLAELPPDCEVIGLAAPNGKALDLRTGQPVKALEGLASAYKWLADASGRVLCVWDWHMLADNPGQWRALSDALPSIRQPRGEGASSLAVFVAPRWNLSQSNPLRDSLPVVRLPLPDRDGLAAALAPVASGAGLESPGPVVIDSVVGLTASAAQQAAAEVVARCGKWDSDALRERRKEELRKAGLEIWPAVDDAGLGGLGRLKRVIEGELLPWVRDPQLAIRRVIAVGVPGSGKSFFPRWVAGKIGCECARLSIARLKRGIVGESEGALRRALDTVHAMADGAPIVVVIDEIDSIAREGLDGGTSSGMFSELLTWLQQDDSQAIVVGTLNHLDKLDAALESRFALRFFFDLPSTGEREAVARIHLNRLGCEDIDASARTVAAVTEGYSSREIAESIIPSVARLTARKPTGAVIQRVVADTVPASRTQGEQLQRMRSAASTLRPANDPETAAPTGRRINLDK